MANNCYNHITINGNKRNIATFSKLLNSYKILTNNNGTEMYGELIREFTSDEDEFDTPRWFDMEIIDEDENCIIISGDSAWSPCLDLFKIISERYKSLQIRYEYEEMGCDFSGWADISKGECSDNEFKYWQGMIALNGEKEATSMFISNELSCYETEEDLIPVLVYFSEESKKEILEVFNSN